MERMPVAVRQQRIRDMLQRARVRSAQLAGVPAAALLACIVIVAPASDIAPAAGLDSSWRVSLNTFGNYGLKFGRQLNFTWGPWGFLDQPEETSKLNLLAGLTYSVIAVAVTWLALYYLLRRVSTSTEASLAAAALVWLLSQNNTISSLLLMGGGALALLYAGDAALRLRHGNLPALLSAEAALVLQIKFSIGLALAAIVVVCVGVDGWRRALRRAVAAGLTFLAVTVVAWLAAAQSLSDFPGWVSASMQISRGYTDAMSLEDRPNVVPYLIVGVVLILVLGFFVRDWRLDGARLTVAPVLIAGIMLYLAFREVTARHQLGRQPFFLLAAVPVLAWLLRPGRPWRARAAVLAGAALFAAQSWLPADPSTVLNRWSTQVQASVDTQYQGAQLKLARQQAQQTYQLSDGMRTAIGTNPVTVDSFESAVPWAYNLNWRPAPVFQTYVAYTAALDRRNADVISSASDGQRVLRSAVGAIDGRNPLWDSPRYVVAELCGYRTELADSRWLLLDKTAGRCGGPQQVSSSAVARSTPVTVPAVTGDQLLVMSFQAAKPGLLTQLGRTLNKSFAPLTVNCGATGYRLPRALATGPLVVHMPRTTGWPAPFLGAFTCSSVTFSEAGTVRFSVIPLATTR
jgi:hypothetical protein